MVQQLYSLPSFDAADQGFFTSYFPPSSQAPSSYPPFPRDEPQQHSPQR